MCVWGACMCEFVWNFVATKTEWVDGETLIFSILWSTILRYFVPFLLCVWVFVTSKTWSYSSYMYLYIRRIPFYLYILCIHVCVLKMELLTVHFHNNKFENDLKSSICSNFDSILDPLQAYTFNSIQLRQQFDEVSFSYEILRKFCLFFVCLLSLSKFYFHEIYLGEC